MNVGRVPFRCLYASARDLSEASDNDGRLTIGWMFGAEAIWRRYARALGGFGLADADLDE